MGSASKAVAAIVLVFAAAVVAMMAMTSWTERKMASFCATIQPGSDIATVWTQVEAAGYHSPWARRELKADERIVIMTRPSASFIRAGCMVSVSNGKVVATQTTPVD